MVCATFRMKDIKLFAIILSIVFGVALLIFITYKHITKDIINLYTYEDRIEYLESLDLSTDNISESSKEITIPTEFNSTYEDYAELQISKGFPDLHTFKGDTAITYNYTLQDGSVVQLLICNDILVGTSL